jgi:hypothetical protein
MADGGSQIGVPPPAPAPVGFREPNSFANVLSLLAFLLSLFAAWRASRRDERAERIARSDPWVTLLLSPLLEEIVSVRKEADLVRQFCTVPFETEDRKREVRSDLNRFRTESAQRLYMMVALCPQSAELQTKRAMLSGGEDSFFDNSELMLAKERADGVVTEYERKLADFLKCIRSLVAKITSRQFHPEEVD